MTKLNTTEVIHLAIHLHQKQKQMYGNKLYSYHLEQVYLSYKHLFGFADDVTTQVIYLHDTLEDCDITSSELEVLGVDPLVVSIVGTLTKQKGETRRVYIERIMKCEIAKEVKSADSFSNLQHSFKSGNDRLITKYTENLTTLMKGT